MGKSKLARSHQHCMGALPISFMAHNPARDLALVLPSCNITEPALTLDLLLHSKTSILSNKRASNRQKKKKIPAIKAQTKNESTCREHMYRDNLNMEVGSTMPARASSLPRHSPQPAL